jgi:hypothetical protein
MKTYSITAGALALLLGGCMTLPVTGRVQESSETFTGEATGYASGAGVLKIKSSEGAECSGDFVYVTRRQGEGTMSCTDGRSGPFRFVSTGTRGTGTGEIDGRPFIFSFGG